jgi:hypothetical protein
MTEAPLLPLSNVHEDAICVVSVQNNWYRVQIVSHNPQTQTCLVKYLDFGGYISVLASDLRQIRTDFMTVPFQAMECLLSNIRPIGRLPIKNFIICIVFFIGKLKKKINLKEYILLGFEPQNF